MDNLTHTLFGLALARSVGRPLTAHSTAVLLLAVNAPDIDVVSRLVSNTEFLAYHRGITHSFAAAPFLSAAVVGIVLLARKLAKSQSPFRPARAFLAALIGVLLGHLFLDWATSYGTRLLLPFSARWLAWDAVPIVDVWLLLALVIFLFVPYFFRMISEEIGAHKNTGRTGAVLAVLFLLTWFGFRGVLHSRALAVLDSRLYRDQAPRRIAALADIVNPFLWHAVVETDGGWDVTQLRLLDNFDPANMRSYYKPEPSAALDAARETRTARVFLDFARFPYSYVEREQDEYQVIYRDLRFENNVTGARGFVAIIVENQQLQVVSTDFHFRPPKPVR